MSKRILYILIVLISSAFSVKAQSNILSPIDTLSIDTTLYSSQSDLINIFNLTNHSTTDTLHMKWKVGANTFPQAWNVQICNPNLCYSNLNNVKSYEFPPNQTGIMKIDVLPMCTSGSGLFQIHVWAANDSANTSQNLIYKMTVVSAACLTGISEPEVTQISIYPNPAKDQLTLNLPQALSNGRVDIYTAIGTRAYTKELNSHDAVQNLDISSLDGGVYIIRILENGKTVTSGKFSKVD